MTIFFFMDVTNMTEIKTLFIPLRKRWFTCTYLFFSACIGGFANHLHHVSLFDIKQINVLNDKHTVGVYYLSNCQNDNCGKNVYKLNYQSKKKNLLLPVIFYLNERQVPDILCVRLI